MTERYFILPKCAPELEIPENLDTDRAVALYQARYDALQPLCKCLESLGYKESEYYPSAVQFHIEAPLTPEQLGQIRNNLLVGRVLTLHEYFIEFVEPINNCRCSN